MHKNFVETKNVLRTFLRLRRSHTTTSLYAAVRGEGEKEAIAKIKEPAVPEKPGTTTKPGNTSKPQGNKTNGTHKECASHILAPAAVAYDNFIVRRSAHPAKRFMI